MRISASQLSVFTNVFHDQCRCHIKPPLTQGYRLAPADTSPGICYCDTLHTSMPGLPKVLRLNVRQVPSANTASPVQQLHNLAFDVMLPVSPAPLETCSSS
jgi:hypothetical protein